MRAVAVLALAVLAALASAEASHECLDSQPMYIKSGEGRGVESIAEVSAGSHSLLPLCGYLCSTGYRHAVRTIRAQIQAKAPEFTADAVVDGELTKVSLSDLKGASAAGNDGVVRGRGGT